MAERPSETATAQWNRLCADDLKAMYFEARLAQQPSASGEAVNSWFWRDTALANLLRALRDRLADSDDPATKGVAYGIAR